MELQDQMMSDWSHCDLPPTSVNHRLLFRELKSSCMWPQGSSDAYGNIWTEIEPARVKTCSSRSFAMDARIRLDSLKSGCNPPLPYCATKRFMYNYNCGKDLWDSEESQKEESALDQVEILDIEDDEQDEECWLYESPRKQSFVEKKESALKWCRHVLDNPSPEMEAACRVLTKMLDQGSSRQLYKHPAGFYRAASVPVGSSVDKTAASTAPDTPDNLVCTDHSEPSISLDSIKKSYRLQDVHIMAQLQEASLRQDYVSMPTTASQRRNPEPPVMLSSSFNTTDENSAYSAPGNKSEASSSTSAAKQCCQSPKPSRLHQQVTQFKLLKLAQNQAASPGGTRSPLRTSLRSLQAVRNSRSLETEDYQPEDQITYSDVSSARGQRLRCWSPSFSPASLNSSSLLESMANPSVRTAAMKKLHRSQSLSPCRIPQSAKGYFSVHGRVFTSPERPTTVAWARNAPSIQR